MASIEDGFANGIARVSGGFDSSILGQASYIDRLQQTGSWALGNSAIGAAQAPSLEQAIAMVNRDPSLIPLALEVLQDPGTFFTVLNGLAAQPQLIGLLPPDIFGFIQDVLSG
jgi:hypothetical protein